MKVVNPNVRIKTISLIPRFNDVEAFDLLLINETTKEETTFFIDNYSYQNGILVFGVDFAMNEGDKYELKLSILNEVLYRGKIFSTAQEPQDFDLTKDLYIYE
jgi:hypothetical protein